MHVLTLTPFYPSAEDETNGCFVAEPLQHLSRQNISSTVMAVQPVYRRRNDLSEVNPARWMRYFQLPGSFGLADAGRTLFLRIRQDVERLHQRRRVDLIHAHAALPCGHAASALSRRLNIPFVVTVHGLDVFNSCFRTGAAANRRKNVSTKVFKEASKVICVSEKIEQLLTDSGSSGLRSTVIYNGTDTDLFSPGAANENGQRTILMVGNLLPIKGQDLVLRAFSKLKKTHDRLFCQVIGEGPDRERLDNLVRTLGVDHQVQFLGRRSRSEVAEAMRTSTLFALPSRYEGLGCVYLEAMACGKPVIACHSQGIAEIIRHGRNGWLVKEGSLDELIEAMSILLAKDDLRAQIGAQARQTILSALTLEHQAERMMQVYEEAVRWHAGRA